jgi:hypothetical protein
MAGPSGVLDLGQPTEMVPLSGDALISVLKTRQAQSIVDLAMPGDLISVIEFPTSGIDFSKVVLQIPGDGANNSTNIVDVSQNALTITRSGNPVITTSDPKCGTGSVQLRSSTFDRLAIDSSILNSLDQDFWIEFWLRRVDVNASDFYVNLGQDELQWFSQTSHLRQAWNAYGTSVTGDLELRLYMGGSVTNQANFYCVRFVNYAGNSQVFNHFCAGRVNGQLAAWFNGSISQDPGSVYGSAGTVNIGTRQVVATGTKTFLGPRNSGTGFNNYPSADVDDFRYVIDTPPWGLNNFTVPTSPHPVG